MNENDNIRNMPENSATRQTPPYRPSLRFFHPSPKGNGGALKMELHPAHGNVDGSIWVKAANQMTIGCHAGPNPTFPRFDWENAITVKLDFSDLCKMLQVFRGECESLENDLGICHRSSMGMTRIKLRHLIGQVQGYSFELYRTPAHGEETRTHILFRDWEALGIEEAIAGSMSVITFGIPVVIPRETGVGATGGKEARHVSVA